MSIGHGVVDGSMDYGASGIDEKHQHGLEIWKR